MPSLWTRASASLQLAAEYLIASIRRDKRGTCFGIITVALVVCFSAILQAAIDASPVVFLRLAESQASEVDAYLLPEISADSQLPLINHTAYCGALSLVNPGVAGCAPRWTVLGDLSSASQPARRTSAFVLALDSRAEAAAGLGRAWGQRALGAAEAYVLQTALDEIGVTAGVGERVTVLLNVPKVLGSITAAASTGGTTAAAAYGEGSAAANASSAGSLAPPPQTNAQFIEALLAAAGVTLGDTWVTVDALAALRTALAVSGLGEAVNVSAGAGGSLVRVNLGPVLRAAVEQVGGAREPWAGPPGSTREACCAGCLLRTSLPAWLPALLHSSRPRRHWTSRRHTPSSRGSSHPRVREAVRC